VRNNTDASYQISEPLLLVPPPGWQRLSAITVITFVSMETWSYSRIWHMERMRKRLQHL
jgi:hypothetical protein